MSLTVAHKTLEEIPEAYQDLYSKQGEQFVLTGIGGIKTQGDVDRLTESLRKERSDHREVKDRLAVWGDLDHTDVMGKIDRIGELELAAKGKMDDEAIDTLVETRLVSRIAPVERQLEAMTKENTQLKETNEQYAHKDRTRLIRDNVRKALVADKVLESAQEDALMIAERVFEITEHGDVVTRDGVGVTPGIDAKVWLQDMTESRPHWWPTSGGGGAGGSDGGGGGTANPWSAKAWSLTEQGTMVRTLGMAKAQEMAKAAGSFVGATSPTVDKK